MVTIPKQWREELGLKEGDVVRAKKEGSRLVIEPNKSNLAPYRVYSSAEIDAFLKEDKLPKSLAKKVQKDLRVRTSK
jgi:AbrB family looped-hinge helix DNA binding protein